MKTYLFFLFALPLQLFSQVVAIQNSSQGNVAMLCMYTHLTIAAEGYMSDSIAVSTDNGSITADESGAKGHYNLMPKAPGRATVYVKKNTARSNGEIIDSVAFFVKRMPLSIPRFGGMSKGEISQSSVVQQVALAAQVECCGFDAKFNINKFTVVVQRRKKEIFRRIITGEKGGRIDSITHDFFYKLRNKDRLIFDEITIKDCDGELRKLESIEFTITDAHKYRDVEVTDAVIVDPISGEEFHKSKTIVKERIK